MRMYFWVYYVANPYYAYWIVYFFQIISMVPCRLGKEYKDGVEGHDLDAS